MYFGSKYERFLAKFDGGDVGKCIPTLYEGRTRCHFFDSATNRFFQQKINPDVPYDVTPTYCGNNKMSQILSFDLIFMKSLLIIIYIYASLVPSIPPITSANRVLNRNQRS